MRCAARRHSSNNKNTETHSLFLFFLPAVAFFFYSIPFLSPFTTLTGVQKGFNTTSAFLQKGFAAPARQWCRSTLSSAACLGTSGWGRPWMHHECTGRETRPPKKEEERTPLHDRSSRSRSSGSRNITSMNGWEKRGAINDSVRPFYCLNVQEMTWQRKQKYTTNGWKLIVIKVHAVNRNTKRKKKALS